MHPGLALLALSLTACVTSTDACGPGLVVTGTWDYSAIQSSPAPDSLAGTLTIASQARCSFTGSASVTEIDGGGSRPLAGPISGQTLNDTTVDFDVFFDANARRHVASVVRDTMRGGWVETSGASTFAGSFLAVHRSTP